MHEGVPRLLPSVNVKIQTTKRLVYDLRGEYIPEKQDPPLLETPQTDHRHHGGERSRKPEVTLLSHLWRTCEYHC